MHFWRIVPFLFITGSLLGSAGSARAADPTESAAEANALTAKAAALYDEGVVAYKNGQWAPARASFLAAWSLKKHWQIAGNLADCELQLNRYREAAEHAAYYFRNAPADRRARAQALLEKAQTGTCTLTIPVDQAGAEVLVDGLAVGVSPLDGPVFVDPGHHAVEARLGSRSASASADVLVGARKDIPLVLKDIAVKDGGTTRAGPSLPVIVAGASVAGAALLVGTVLALVADGKASSANAALAMLPPNGSALPCQTQASTCATINSDRHARDALSNASMGTFIGAGAVGLATLGYALLAPKTRPSTGLQVLPAMGAGRGGVALMGVW